MERTGWQQNWVRILTTVLTAAVMVLIFCFSTESAERSDQTSGKISRQVVYMVYPNYDQKTTEEQQACYEMVQHHVRKTAHFTEYAVLGMMIRFCLASWFGRRSGLSAAAWITGTLYSGTDELHQLLIDGRSGQWTDVLLDSCGVLTGVLIAGLILLLTWKKRRQA